MPVTDPCLQICKSQGCAHLRVFVGCRLLSSARHASGPPRCSVLGDAVKVRCVQQSPRNQNCPPTDSVSDESPAPTEP